MNSRPRMSGPVAIVLASLLVLAASSNVMADEEEYPTLKYWVTDDAGVLLL